MEHATLDRRLTPARPDLADERLVGRVEAVRFIAPVLMQVVVPSAPLRREPRPDAALDTEALLGEAVAVYERGEGIAWVQLLADGYVGYMPEEALGPAMPAPTHRVSALRTFVYPGPSMKLPPVAHLSFGAGVTPSGAQGDFVKVAGGFLFAGHVSPADAVVADFVSVAELFMHTPYLWGGKTSLGLDCSGLVQLALAAAGITAPRDTDLQRAALGEDIPYDETLGGLWRGDLVFWGGHVGIMLDEATLLHANGHHMSVAAEPLAVAERRIREKSYGPIVGIKRLAAGR